MLSNSESDSSLQDQLPIVPTVPDLSYQIERTNELIGKGGYGSVYKGKWRPSSNTTPVIIAIKIIDLVPLNDEVRRKRRFKQITRELSLWCRIQHKNILPLWGIACINDDTNVPAFVCPWMENGNAREFCLNNPHFPPILILYDIINGLHYLHTFKPEIVHGDIKAVNVLINNRCEACLCDFGLSRFIIDDTLWKTTATVAGGTGRWMAPELMNGDTSIPTKESDMYAYAMTCYEIMSGDVPFKSVSNDMAIVFKVTQGQRPCRIESVHSDFMWNIITQCWEQEPQDRLTTEKVSELLQSKVDWRKTEEALSNIEGNDFALTKDQEIRVLKEQLAAALAKAETDLNAMKDEKEEALAKVELELQVLREERNAALRRGEMDEYSTTQHAEEKRNAEMEEKIARMDANVAHLNHILVEMTTALSNAEEVAAKREQLIRDLSDENHHLREDIRQMKTAHCTNEENMQTNALLPRSIVYKADEISVTKVAELVRTLNAQIVQASSFMTDSLFDHELTSIDTELEVWDELDDYIGSWLCNDLKRRWKEFTVEPNSVMTQITLQTGLVSACSRIINDWNPPFWTEGLIFSRTYRRIKETKGQATADAWKAMSLSNMTTVLRERQEANNTYLMEVLLKLITALGGTLEGRATLLSRYKEKVDNVVRKAVELHQIISEEVTSAELVTYTVSCADEFDPSQMEDMEGDEYKGRSDIVICTVKMGLRCRKRDKSEKIIKEEWDVTVKPKVVLATTLET